MRTACVSLRRGLTCASYLCSSAGPGQLTPTAPRTYGTWAWKWCAPEPPDPPYPDDEGQVEGGEPPPRRAWDPRDSRALARVGVMPEPYSQL